MTYVSVWKTVANLPIGKLKFLFGLMTKIPDPELALDPSVNQIRAHLC